MSDMKRTLETWKGCDPIYMSVMSPAAICYALADAKNDIIKLHSDYGTAISQLAALREELDTMTAAAKAIRDEWRIDQQRLADAERRNAELVDTLRSLPDELAELSGCENTAGVWACIEYIRDTIAALNPKPEAASHDE